MERDNCSRRAELLAPAGSLEILKAVALAGADAVYAGGEKFGARAYARNFTEDELKDIGEREGNRGVMGLFAPFV